MQTKLYYIYNRYIYYICVSSIVEEDEMGVVSIP